VNSISVHPKGGAALSVGQDKNLCLWDLLRGKKALSIRLPESEFTEPLSFLLISALRIGKAFRHRVTLFRGRTRTLVGGRFAVRRSVFEYCANIQFRGEFGFGCFSCPCDNPFFFVDNISFSRERSRAN
jgi:hypothetical protein